MTSRGDLDGLMKFMTRDPWRDCFQDVLDEHFGEVLGEEMDLDDLADLLAPVR